MTREEAVKKVTDVYADGVSNRTVVNSIYDNFESRTCESCKWNNSNEYIRSCSLVGYTRYEDFGCNRWEQKETHE